MTFPPPSNLLYCNPSADFHSNLQAFSLWLTETLLTIFPMFAIISTADISITDIINSQSSVQQVTDTSPEQKSKNASNETAVYFMKFAH